MNKEIFNMAVKITLSGVMGTKRITQTELANKTGIRRATINELYNDIATSINLKHLNKICKYLNCTPLDLITYTPDDK